jgi:uncharacterized membrane protein YsdA (DUF1294 family)
MIASMDVVVLIGAFLMLNAASFVMYFLDKRAAVRKGRRISEKTLLIAALVAPFGAVGGMRIFRHKTRKTKFLLTYVFLGLHVLLLAYLLVPGLASGLTSLLP